MKKIYISLLSIFCALLLSFPVHAAEPDAVIDEGYTSNGIHYVVYDIETHMNQERVIGNTVDVIREVHFSGIIVPSSTQLWFENINGTDYSGTLKLYNCSYENNTTIAYYRGTLTAIN